MNIIRIETNCKLGTLTQEKESNFKEEWQEFEITKNAGLAENNVKNKV